MNKGFDYYRVESYKQNASLRPKSQSHGRISLNRSVEISNESSIYSGVVLGNNLEPNQQRRSLVSTSIPKFKLLPRKFQMYSAPEKEPLFLRIEDFLDFYRNEKDIKDQNSRLNQALEIFIRERTKLENKITELKEENKDFETCKTHFEKITKLCNSYKSRFLKSQDQILSLLDENRNLKIAYRQVDELKTTIMQTTEILKDVTKKYNELQNDFNKLSENYKDSDAKRKKLEDILEAQGRNKVNELIFSRIEEANNNNDVDSYISFLQELADNLHPSEETRKNTSKILADLEDKVAQNGNFTEHEHMLVAYNEYTKAQKVSLVIDNRFKKSLDPMDCNKKNIEIEIEKSELDGIRDENERSSLIIKSMANIIDTPESELKISKIEEKNDSKINYYIMNKNDLNLEYNKLDMLEDKVLIKRAFEEILKKTIKGEIKVSKQNLFDYFIINKEIFLEKIKIYDTQKDSNPVCKSETHYKHFGLQGHKFNIEKQYPGQKDNIKKWSKLYYAPYNNINQNGDSKLIVTDLVNNTNHINKEVNRNNVICVQYAPEAENLAKKIPFQHDGKILFYFKVIFMARVNPDFLKEIVLPARFCESYRLKNYQVEGFNSIRNIRMMIKKIDDANDEMVHANHCYLCKYIKNPHKKLSFK